MIVGIWNASIPLGSALGIALGGFIATRYGWRHAFGIVALPGLLIALLFFFVKDYRTVELVKSDKRPDQARPPQRMTSPEIVREFTQTPSLFSDFFCLFREYVFNHGADQLAAFLFQSGPGPAHG